MRSAISLNLAFSGASSSSVIKHLRDTNEEFRQNVTAIWEQIKSIFSGFWQGIVDRINALGFDFKNITEVIKTVFHSRCLSEQKDCP